MFPMQNKQQEQQQQRSNNKENGGDNSTNEPEHPRKPTTQPRQHPVDAPFPRVSSPATAFISASSRFARSPVDTICASPAGIDRWRCEKEALGYLVSKNGRVHPARAIKPRIFTVPGQGGENKPTQRCEGESGAWWQVAHLASLLQRGCELAENTQCITSRCVPIQSKRILGQLCKGGTFQLSRMHASN